MYRQRFKTQHEPGATPESPQAKWRVPAIALLMLLIGLSIGYLSRPAIEARLTGTPETATNSTESLESLKVELQSQTRHYLGSADAPVTLIEFGDFQ